MNTGPGRDEGDRASAGLTAPRLRTAKAADAEAVALLHADSWRRHYRGAYSDAFLDGDLVTNRRSVWSSRMTDPAGSLTVLAEDDSGLVGFTHVIFAADDRWGSLVDNLHVRADRRRGGVGRALLVRAGHATAQRPDRALYLWVLEQNIAAQAFYHALGGETVERAPVPPPAGNPANLNGCPSGLRVVWPDATVLARMEVCRPSPSI
jgi:ribosomal protein S18 acetylase RimI-like enzyme